MRAAIYVRQSEDKRGDGAAVSRQLEQCRELAERHGFDVLGVYSDNDVSASSGKRRPEWQRLLKDLGAGSFEVLICWHVDRLYRRLRDLADLVELAESQALRIIAVRAGDIDLSTPAGRMLASMLGSAARYEVEQKSVRQKAANLQRARKGVTLWSRRPFGFDRHGEQIVIVEDEAREIRRMAEGILAGRTLYSIAADLNSRHIPTTLGNPWVINGIVRSVSNPRVVGRVVYNGEDYGQGSWPPILKPDEYDQVQAILSDPRRSTTNDRRFKHYLSGALICSKCERPMYATTYKTRQGSQYGIYQCKVCKRTRKMAYVDPIVEAALLGRLKRPDVSNLLHPSPDVAGWQDEIAQLRIRRDGLAGLLADGLLTPGAVRAQAQRLAQRIEELELRLSRATSGSPLADLAAADDVDAAWNALGARQKRGIVETLMTVRVLAAGKGQPFSPQQLEITWKGERL